jgi:hypothetical protein
VRVRGKRRLGGALTRGRPMHYRGARCMAGVRGESGQKEYDKRTRRCCARGFTGSGRGRWREDGSRVGRSARGDKAERMPARCSMQSCPSEQGRWQPGGR